MTVQEIWEYEKGINPITYMRENPGASWDDAIKEFNRKIADVCTPEEYTISELSQCDIKVDVAQIIYTVKSAFPAVSDRKIAAWIIANIKEHQQAFTPLAWTKYGTNETYTYPMHIYGNIAGEINVTTDQRQHYDSKRN